MLNTVENTIIPIVPTKPTVLRTIANDAIQKTKNMFGTVKTALQTLLTFSNVKT